MNPVKCRANYSRVCQLLVDKGGDALRAALHVVHPPSTLAAVLNANKSVLKKIRYSVINSTQWKLLYPSSGAPDSRNFDVTLLTILLRNICGFPSPATGWNDMPPARDTSISANIARIKIFRNEVYGHTPSAQLDNSTFATLWQEISKPLVNLGIPQQDIDELKEAPLSPEEESYIKKLKEWKELEDDLLSKLNDLERELIKLRRTMENGNPSEVDRLAKFDFTGKIDGLCKKFQDGTRQWFFEKLSSWFRNNQSRVMILTAGPGVGKSVLSAKVCDSYKQSGHLAAYHFCDFKNSDSRNPNRILQSLASQMCHSVEGFRDKLTEVFRREHSRDSLSDAFRVLLNDPLHALKRREPMLIVVDALDETMTDDKSEFLELISDEFAQLPKWIKILITSRPELQVRKKLERLSPLEILPDDHKHNLDLNDFIQHCLPDLSRDNVSSLISNCEGSFLYAYYLVNELKEMDLGIEASLPDYVPKGISGFYKKQFERLKIGLQPFNPDTCSSILNSFVNVVAVSKEPLPINILFSCMGLIGAEYEIRETIIGIMSEILPLCEDCLTVYHKSLWDWLTSHGYDEHAFVANLEDGRKRLWQACKGIYSDITSLRSVSDFEITTETRYALKNGGKYLLDVGTAEDFHWLMNIRLNFLKLKFFNNLNVGISRIGEFYKAKRLHYPCPHQLGILYQLYEREHFYKKKEKMCYIFLQSFASGYVDFTQEAIDGKKEAKDILAVTNESWIEEKRNQFNSNFKIAFHTITGTRLGLFKMNHAMALSTDNKLLAYRDRTKVEVFTLPTLVMDFDLKISNLRNSSDFLIFSPDSSYLLWNSVRSCISLREQKELPLIPHGPESVDCCSFSSCGMKLVSSEKNLLKVWDVKKKSILVQVETDFLAKYFLFSNCMSYIVALPVISVMNEFSFNDMVFLESATLKRLAAKKISCANTSCLTYESCYQIISPSNLHIQSLLDNFEIRHFHLPSGGIFVIANKHCSKPFTWKGRKCVIFSNWRISSFVVVYDFIKQESVELFSINCLPSSISINCISKLDETNLFVCLSDDEVFILEFEPPTNTSVASFGSGSDTKCYALSPDNLYLACCNENRNLTIRDVDSGETLQTAVMKQPPESCWWSELYLWLVCKGVVVKYPYDSKRTKMLGNYLKECAIDFESVLKFAEGVLVVRLSDNGEISILKIRNQKIYRQKIPDKSFSATSVAISSDGCAVLLYRKSCSDYQLWELACEGTFNRTVRRYTWKVGSSGTLDDSEVLRFSLTGTENSRSSKWLTCFFKSERDEPGLLCLSSIDFPSCKQNFSHNLCLNPFGSEVVHLDSKILIIHKDEWIYFLIPSSGEVTSSLFVGEIPRFQNVSSFYIPSRAILVLAGTRHTKFFKIHIIKSDLDLIKDRALRSLRDHLEQ